MIEMTQVRGFFRHDGRNPGHYMFFPAKVSSASALTGSTIRGLVLGVGLAGLSSMCLARTLSICISQNPVPPLTYPDKEGEAQALVRQAIESRGDTVTFIALPWARCRLGVKAGVYVAAIPLAATATNLADFAFPMKNGTVDKTRTIGSMVIGVVRRVGSSIDWNGAVFLNLKSPVMVLPGQMSARDKLTELGVAQDAGAVNAESLLRKLALGRGELAVLPAGIIETALKTEEFRDTLEMLRIPLTSEMTYLGFNQEFEQKESAYTKALWAEIARLAAPKPRKARVTVPGP